MSFNVQSARNQSHFIRFMQNGMLSLISGLHWFFDKDYQTKEISDQNKNFNIFFTFYTAFSF